MNFQNIIGSNHNDALIGSGGDNVLIEQAGNNLLVGGAGHDTFAFVASQSSTDVIADFHVGEDKLAFIGADSLSDLHISQAGANTIISFDNGQGHIMLDNVNVSDLMAHASTGFVFTDSLETLVS